MTATSMPAPGAVSEKTAAREGRRPRAVAGIAIIVAALVTAAASFAILLGLTPISPDDRVTLLVIGINLAFVLLLLGLIGREVWTIYMARRRGRAASRLHVRIVAMFSLVAALPAILVAIVASVTLDIGLDRWFELRTKVIINSSLSIAEAYVRENARSLQGTTLSMANDVDQARRLYNLDRNGFFRFLSQQATGRSLAHAAIIRSDGSLVIAADTNTDVPLPEPLMEAVTMAADGEPILIEPRSSNVVGAVMKLEEYDDLYLYTIREIDAEVIRARQLVRANTDEYRGLESNRLSTQVAFALVYIGITLIIVLSAIWTGITVADRLVRPIRQLIGAASEVASGNLDVAVPVRRTDGDMASLGDTFNKMTRQLKTQRSQLLSAKDVIDERRRFTEAVLSGVTAGVIGVDATGVINIFNRSAEDMLAIAESDALGKELSAVLPQIGKVLVAGRRSGRPVHRDQVTFYRRGAERTFNVQITVEAEKRAGQQKSYVVTVDDITDLVQAQRTTAWADVARRIAHEIKNPLTPIQLSAERIRRRFGKVIEEDREIFEQCTDTIIRQVGDIGRMVDEFSAFARMPKPDMKELDLREPLREASFLVEMGRNDIAFERVFGNEPLTGTYDTRLLGQAFGNVIKNAAEAIDGALRDGGEAGVIRIHAYRRNGRNVVDIMDNGKGLPRENRQRLLEPYMTTREKGTGLGLAIVKKIVEDHGGQLELHDAPSSFHGGRGALIRMTFPHSAQQQTDKKSQVPDRTEEQEKVQDGV
ncbi:PAS domain-containing sensor histidine kinase [Mesorhizobium sp. Z1-4]|uniref:sensor histidine kinase NtrY-like n=1 Tax=Mesorhizobium sp. Z1-4 TaxID=2448478 RepID=UPI000FDC9DCA|nr:PAS domain-containing sensor histidine kinase [Mesorhizobium sp. Z1-4]